ncbi:hypothetical protein AGABI2DRAFT_191997 [Agaricus bisporus var. bisporus H97]|uniref:hypothetical protein n=1 Tax=Agaricus bisporus var. bisporus (strain H97 / ATCC MYA-4626 / FGSC 10389) TaxID=936046 RepID=UPI00029F7CDA|nr:hypothetical protein AGABI2DRAFT_191997 [Agaricus bisporus var. bisporus H97]EKV48371.1 hypothetical protein AGABI2DRAFT_191997 [Agaricus bisporus var. bisporus H97]
MQPPTSREARLETLLGERETQLSQLHDEVARLRRFLPSQPAPSSTTPLSLPPAVSSLLLSQLSTASESTASSGSSTVVAALTQRARLLQEENDELYQLLRYSETGKLKEEVRGLRRLVQRLQGALRQSHETISLLSHELDKSYDTYLSVAQSAPSPQPSPKTYPPSPMNNYASPPSGNNSHGSKHPPIGPRKRPRLSEPNSNSHSYSGKSHNTSHNHYNHNPSKRGDNHPKRSDKDVRGGHDANKGNRSSKMDVDNEHPLPTESGRGWEKDMDREHDKESGRERNRERDRDRGPQGQDRSRDRGLNTNLSRRNGGGPGRTRRGDRAAGGGQAFHGASNATPNNVYGINGDRTLAERMGL